MPLPLRHEDLAELVGTRRLTVSEALAKLACDGLLTRRADWTWLLAGDPPAEVGEMRRTRDLPLHAAAPTGAVDTPKPAELRARFASGALMYERRHASFRARTAWVPPSH